MVNLNELRRGNFVRDAVVNSRIIKVSEITPDHILHEGDESEEPFADDEIDGIPLTPEILEKCGFRKGERWHIHQVFYKDQIELCYNRNETVYGDKTEHGFNKKSINIKHLHQLQNLYFGLTGTELEINLTE